MKSLRILDIAVDIRLIIKFREQIKNSLIREINFNIEGKSENEDVKLFIYFLFSLEFIGKITV
jgi:hypothetical protein